MGYELKVELLVNNVRYDFNIYLTVSVNKNTPVIVNLPFLTQAHPRKIAVIVHFPETRMVWTTNRSQ